MIKLKSLQGARNGIRDIVIQSKNIHFVEQYQLDEFLGEPYRRMIILTYKIHSEMKIRILQIFDNRQNSIKLKK